MAEPPLLLHVFPSFAIGGAQVRFAAVANRFGRRWRHAVVAMDGNLSCRERLAPSLDVAFPALELPKGDTLGNLRRCRSALRALRPDVLVTSNFGSIEWALANAWPLAPPLARHVHTEDGFGREERSRQLPRRVWTRRLALRRSTLVVPSRTLQRIATETWRLDASRVRYIPNGIDLGRFAPAASRLHSAVVIGTVAALRPEKNLGRLLRAFAQLSPEPASRLVVVGDGPEQAALQALAETLRIADRVTFAGHQSRPELAYAGFDLFALSSDTEQMPLSVLEAMAAGLPVAATDVGDVAAMLAAANRPYVVPPDEAALAAVLARLVADPTQRQDLGAANRARAEADYDQEHTFQTYAALFAGPAVAGDASADAYPGAGVAPAE